MQSPTRNLYTRTGYHADTDTKNYFALLAAIFRQAVTDARAGRQDAINWLDYALPEWRKLTDWKGKPQPPKATAKPTTKRRPLY